MSITLVTIRRNIRNSHENASVCFSRCCVSAVFWIHRRSNGANDNAGLRSAVTGGNDLYLVSRAGTVETRFTADRSPKLSAAIAPDASKVAFIPTATPQSFTVVNSKAKTVSTVVAASSSGGVFTDVLWDADDALAAQTHVGQIESAFSFYRVPPDLRGPL